MVTRHGEKKSLDDGNATLRNRSPFPSIFHAWPMSNRKIDDEKHAFFPPKTFQRDEVIGSWRKKFFPIGRWSVARSTRFLRFEYRDKNGLVSGKTITPQAYVTRIIEFSFFLSRALQLPPSPDFVSLTDSIWFPKILYLFLSPSNKADTK